MDKAAVKTWKKKKTHKILEGVYTQVALQESLSSISPLKKTKQEILEAVWWEQFVQKSPQ